MTVVWYSLYKFVYKIIWKFENVIQPKTENPVVLFFFFFTEN